MTLSESLSSAADYTRRFFERAGDVLLLFILTIIPIVNIFTLGYYGRVVSDRSDSRQPPKAERYGDMFLGGLKFLAAAIIWSIPLIIVAVIAVISVFAPATYVFSQSIAGNFTNPASWQNFNSTNWGQIISQYPGVAATFLLAGIWAAIIMVIVAVAISIFAFMGIVHMFKTGSLTKAFALGEIRSIISKVGWGRYLGYLLVAIFLGIIVSIFNSIPVIGYLVSVFLGLLLLIFLGRTIGLMYDKAMMASTVSTQPQAPPMAPVTSEVSPSPATVAVKSSAPVYCSKCGAPNQQDAIYCNKCGKALAK